MKDQYVGDIGDYTKLGLLRVIENAKLSIGVNWYLTPPDGKNDGGKVGFLKKACDTPDVELFNELHILREARLVSAIERSNLLKNAKFYSDKMGGVHRKSWHEKALTHLCSQDVVFLDPDNGFEVKGVNPNFPDGNKYVTYDEVADYYSRNTSVIVYQHWRIPPEKTNDYQGYIERLCCIKEYLPENKRENVKFYCIAAANRDYFFIIQPDHYDKIKQTISAMLKTGWSKHISCRKEICEYIS